MLSRPVTGLPVLLLAGCAFPALGAGGWEVFLSQLAYQKLTTGEHKDDLYDEPNVRRALPDSVRVSNWILDVRKFEIDFPEYSVAPRVAGFVSVELTWDEFKPYLAPTFDPATLPEPIPVRTK